MKRLPRPKEGETLLVTANRLLDGRIVWLDESQKWCDHISQAGQFSYEKAETALKVAQESSAQQEVVGVYEVLAQAGTPPQPVTMREKIRAYGPTSHPDFMYDHATSSQETHS